MQKEGGKVLTTTQAESVKVYNTLVKQGNDIEARAKKAAVKQAEVVSDKTSQAIDKLEQVFQDRVSRSLNRLGMPTTEDVRGLARRAEELTRNVQALAATKTARPAARHRGLFVGSTSQALSHEDSRTGHFATDFVGHRFREDAHPASPSGQRLQFGEHHAQ